MRADAASLTQPQGDRAKSWQEVHDQVVHAARQLSAVPVVWQPRALDTDIHLAGEVYCLRGEAAYLVEALEEIRAAYRDLAKKYHPDRVGHLGPEFLRIAERRMQAINAAYRELLG